MILRTLGFGTLILVSSLQAQDAHKTFQYPLHLLDIGISAGRRGVSVLAAPSLFSKQGKDALVFAWLRFHPDSLTNWLSRAAFVLRSPMLSQPEERIQWTP